MRKVAGLTVALMLLAGCDQIRNAMDTSGYIRVSSVPLIQQVLVNGVPLFQGKPNEKIMEQVCNYVAGDQDKAQFDSFFTSNKVDVKKLATQDAGFSFLANEDIHNYARGCASFIAASVLSTDYLFVADTEHAEGSEGQKALQERLTQLTPTAVHVASFIASLAEMNEHTQYQSVADFKESVAKTIASNSQSFVREVMHDAVNFSDYKNGGKESGYAFAITGRDIALNLNGETWLGEGVAMGTQYEIKVKNNLSATPK